MPFLPTTLPDELVKNHRVLFAVIPAKAGIHYLQAVAKYL
jgi:hypothetical protein